MEKEIRVIVENKNYLLRIDNKGILLSKMVGCGYEKDNDVELTWDEIYELKDGYELLVKKTNEQIDYHNKRRTAEFNEGK